MYPRNALQAASNPKSHVLRQIEYFYHTGIEIAGFGGMDSLQAVASQGDRVVFFSQALAESLPH